MAEKDTSEKRYKSFLPDETVAHARAARAEFEKSVESLLPPDFVKHRKAARREMLLAFRSLIDAAIDYNEGSNAEAE
ncbi:MAG: hypothetical protein R3335_06590 [Anaerolineales bacterium]|nr:hypothetical protein [Anaerolineales bacterium]